MTDATKTMGAQLRPTDELLTMVDAIVAAFMRKELVPVHEAVSALSEAAMRIRADCQALAALRTGREG